MRLERVLITGAAGNIGSALRRGLRGRYPVLRLADLAPLGEAGPGEELRAADIRDLAAVEALMAGVDAAVHLAAIPHEAGFDELLEANIRGTYNVFEAARRRGVGRVVFASTNHVVGMYRRSERLELDVPMRPDSLYGVSKAYGELLGRYYADKFGLEVACLRIGHFGERPESRRELSIWISPADMVQLVAHCLEAPGLGFTVLYGVSANARSWWSNAGAEYVGYRPADDAEVHAEAVLRASPEPDPDDPAEWFQGGSFAAAGFRRDRSRA